MKFFLSQYIPMHFTTVYGVDLFGVMYVERASWWQWRDRIFNHHTVTILKGT